MPVHFTLPEQLKAGEGVEDMSLGRGGVTPTWPPRWRGNFPGE